MPKGRINPVDKYVGSRVRMRRLMLSMSQTEVADALGLAFQQMQKYEKGSNRVSASRLQHLSQILQVPGAFFFEGLPVGAGPEIAAEAKSRDFVSDFVCTWAGASKGFHAHSKREAAPRHYRPGPAAHRRGR